jgi:hypothetical protein
MRDKRGMELAFNTIILIVLGVIVLVAIILIFTRASGSFGEKIDSFFSSSNVDAVVNQCNTLAEQEQTYEFCCVNKTVRLSRAEKFSLSCLEANNNKSWGSKIVVVNCEGVC